VKHDPLTADGADAVADYTPVMLSPRRRGWTADRQRAFLTALAETGSVSVACKSAGITARSAYRLRNDPRGAPFAAAWNQAIYVATNALTLLAFERASKGSYREYWKDGQLVGETRQPSDAMLKFLLTRLARPGSTPVRSRIGTPSSTRSKSCPGCSTRSPIATSPSIA
jgi:hypothetical protein